MGLQKGGIILCLVVLVHLSSEGEAVIPSGKPDGVDLCKWMNGRKYYIGMGETGTISVGNVTSQPTPTNDTFQPRIPQRCSVELITCPSCHFVVTVNYLNIPTCSSDGNCRCDYVWVKEPTIGKSGQEFCGIKRNDSTMVFESKRKLLSVDFLYSYSYMDAFSLQFTAKNNVYTYTGQADYYQGGSSGYVESPHFPVAYPSDYSVEYSLVNSDPRGYVQLVFTDFQLSPWSYIELLNSNGSRIDVYNGNTFRPPIVVSSGAYLTVKFRANDEYANAGFRAKYTFVNYPEKYWFNKPSTDCGGIVDDTGGAITMMNMVAQAGTAKAYDCIWLVKSSSMYASESQISIRVAQFEEMGPQSTLEIRQGLTSVSYLLESLNGHHQSAAKNSQHAQEYIIPATSGFYIRLKGSFTNRSRLAVVYSVFTYDSLCNETNQFMCTNGRCMHPSIHCDGFNHCGDGSDEVGCDGKVVFEKRQQQTVLDDGQTKKAGKDSMSQWWANLTPNYYFPKQESGSETVSGTNTLILLTSLAGLGMFILTTILILIKLRKQRTIEALNREALRSISAEMSDGRRIYPGEAPLFDPPPTYDDVVKFYMPPPPAYSTIDENSPTLGRFNANAMPGVENAAFTMISESPPPTYREATNKNSRILRVILPSSSGDRRHHRRHKNSPAKARSASRRSTQRARRSLESSLVTALLNEEVHRIRKPCQCQGACSCATISRPSGSSTQPTNGNTVTTLRSPPSYYQDRPRPTRNENRPPVPAIHFPQDSISSISSFGSITPAVSTSRPKELSVPRETFSHPPITNQVITIQAQTHAVDEPSTSRPRPTLSNPMSPGTSGVIREPNPRPDRQFTPNANRTPQKIISTVKSPVRQQIPHSSSSTTLHVTPDRNQVPTTTCEVRRKSPRRSPGTALNTRLLAFELDDIESLAEMRRACSMPDVVDPSHPNAVNANRNHHSLGRPHTQLK